MHSQQKNAMHCKQSYLYYTVSISDRQDCLKCPTQDISIHQIYICRKIWELFFFLLQSGTSNFCHICTGQRFPPTRNCFSVLSIMLQKLAAAKHKTVHVVGFVIGCHQHWRNENKSSHESQQKITSEDQRFNACIRSYWTVSTEEYWW